MHSSSLRLNRRRIVLLLILLDQISKILAIRYLAPVGSINSPLVSLTYLENTGISFGLLQETGNRILLAFNLALLGGIIFYYRKHARSFNKFMNWAFLLIIAGAGGNLVDRVLRGFVVDFIDFHFWPVFNLADSMISIGAVLYVIAAFKETSPRS